MEGMTVEQLERVLERVLDKQAAQGAALIEGVRLEVHGLREELRELRVQHDLVTAKRLETLEAGALRLAAVERLETAEARLDRLEGRVVKLEQAEQRQAGGVEVIRGWLPWAVGLVGGVLGIVGAALGVWAVLR